MADVRKPAANDERTVNLTPAQIQALLEPMDEQTRPIVEFALLTGVDMAPILRLRPMDYDPESGTVAVDDRKAVLRKRRVPIPATAEAIIRRQAAGKPEDQPLFELGRWQLQRRYDTARKAAGLGHVRFKDLRGIFATNYISGGGSPKDLMAIMGHSSMTMTLRYIRRSATAGRKEGMDAAAEKMGLGMRQILKVEKGGA
jgi:integrase